MRMLELKMKRFTNRELNVSGLNYRQNMNHTLKLCFLFIRLQVYLQVLFT